MCLCHCAHCLFSGTHPREKQEHPSASHSEPNYSHPLHNGVCDVGRRVLYCLLLLFFFFVPLMPLGLHRLLKLFSGDNLNVLVRQR